MALKQMTAAKCLPPSPSCFPCERRRHDPGVFRALRKEGMAIHREQCNPPVPKRARTTAGGVLDAPISSVCPPPPKRGLHHPEERAAGDQIVAMAPLFPRSCVLPPPATILIDASASWTEFLSGSGGRGGILDAWPISWVYPPPAKRGLHETTAAHHPSLEQRTPAGALRLQIGSAYVPKEGENPVGEDAHFLGKNAFGIADGVGGWAKRGVDSGIFSRELMALVKAELEEQRPSAPSPAAMLERAVAQTTAKGTSTACIAVLHGDTLHAATLGDSGFLVVRRGGVVYHSPVQQKGFNKPFQVGRASPGDAPSCAVTISLRVRAGDVIVAGSDGLLDNMFEGDIADVLAECSSRGFGDPSRISRALAKAAVMLSQDRKRSSPFSVASEAAGRPWTGGKRDDITVVVARVAPA